MLLTLVGRLVTVMFNICNKNWGGNVCVCVCVCRGGGGGGGGKKTGGEWRGDKKERKGRGREVRGGEKEGTKGKEE